MASPGDLNALMLDKKIKQKIIEKFKTHANDTGSTEVQIAILTEEISQLSKHLKIHKKDQSSRRGLLRKVSERRALLKYLARENAKNFESLTTKLKLKKALFEPESTEVRPEENLPAEAETKII